MTISANKSLKTFVVSLTATGDVVAAVAGKRIKVYRYAIQSRNVGMTAQFRDGAAGSLLGLRWGLDAREGVESPCASPPDWLFATTAGNALQAVIGGTGTVDIEVNVWDDDAA